MPQASNTAVSIGKGVNQFKLIMEHTAADQHMHIAALNPVQQFHDQIGDILWQSAKMQDMPFLIYNANGLGTEHTGLIHQTACHDAMGSQQIIHRVGIKLLQSLIDLISVFDLCNIFRRSQNLFAVKNGGDLLQSQRILLDGQGAMNCPDAIGASQSRVG